MTLFTKGNLKEEIFQSISSARNKNADIYQFEDYLFRYKNKLWAQKLHHDMLNNMTIDDIDIKIREVKSSNKISKNEGKREH
ncbi:Ger(x)C family spore germination protein [Cytobacillus horneckiae]|uniref:Ger(x)C family spore germination C-terminal domain-containing protein n=1 Tax=Cytobacillus horneckiae TaxID=549687 RepID=UPI00115C41DD